MNYIALTKEFICCSQYFCVSFFFLLLKWHCNSSISKRHKLHSNKTAQNHGCIETTCKPLEMQHKLIFQLVYSFLQNDFKYIFFSLVTSKCAKFSFLLASNYGNKLPNCTSSMLLHITSSLFVLLVNWSVETFLFCHSSKNLYLSDKE